MIKKKLIEKELKHKLLLRGKFAEQINIFQPSHHLVIILFPGPSNSYFNIHKKINLPCLKVTVIDIF